VHDDVDWSTDAFASATSSASKVPQWGAIASTTRQIGRSSSPCASRPSQSSSTKDDRSATFVWTQNARRMGMTS
jgi:hypothetical protein